jgi:hypothetical protein
VCLPQNPLTIDFRTNLFVPTSMSFQTGLETTTCNRIVYSSNPKNVLKQSVLSQSDNKGSLLPYILPRLPLHAFRASLASFQVLPLSSKLLVSFETNYCQQLNEPEGEKRIEDKNVSTTVRAKKFE